jgi:hypothetical protein
VRATSGERYWWRKEIDALVEGSHQPCLGKGLALRPFEEMGTHAAGDHGRRDEEELENQLGPEAAAFRDAEEQQAVGRPDRDRADEWVTGDGETEHRREHHRGRGVGRDRPGRHAMDEDRASGDELLPQTDRVTPTLGGGPAARSRGRQEEHGHRSADRPSGCGCRTDRRRADDRDDDPNHGGDEAGGAGAPDSLGPIGVLVGTFELPIDEPQGEAVEPIPTFRERHRLSLRTSRAETATGSR